MTSNSIALKGRHTLTKGVALCLTTAILSIFFFQSSFSQNVEFEKANFKGNKDGLKEAIEQVKEGDDAFSEGTTFYKKALAPYLLANKFNPNNALLNFRIGNCYLYS